MSKSSKLKFLAVFSIVVLAVLAFVVFANRGFSSASGAPAISYLESSGATVIVHVRSDSRSAGEQFVYCVSSSKDPATCTWDNSDEFDLAEEGEYFFFIKSLSSGKVSEPKQKTYQIVDYSDYRM